jgi:hypothetical protein
LGQNQATIAKGGAMVKLLVSTGAYYLSFFLAIFVTSKFLDPSGSASFWKALTVVSVISLHGIVAYLDGLTHKRLDTK